MTRSLAGRTILVTGATAGIGRAIAEAIVAADGRVVLHGERGADAEAACRAIGASARAVACDLLDGAAIEAMMREAIAAFGALDGLVNNAGAYPRLSLAESDAAIFDRMMGINARAPFLVARGLVAHLRARKAPGTIVNIGSVNAWSGLAEVPVYSMAKGALMTMTRNLADALGEDGIWVNQLNVGWTFTESEDRLQQAQGRKRGWQREVDRVFAPRGRILEPREIAAHALFWLSDDSAPVSGQVYEVEQYPVIGRLRIPQRG
jgi:NAD(P)-dependent dehydrogenase (short-subunit alcohol dehydrogenase family)